MRRILILSLLAVSSHVFAVIQVVYFNPPVEGIVMCTMDYFSYLDNVLRLDTSSCLSDTIFREGFEGTIERTRECAGGTCP